jgi:hypothetical protein
VLKNRKILLNLKMLFENGLLSAFGSQETEAVSPGCKGASIVQ